MTLIELMLVVSIMMIASRIAFGTLIPYVEQYRVKGAAFMVSAELQRARMEAIRTRACHFFDRTSATQFRIVRDNIAAPNCTLGADDTTLRTINLPVQFPNVSMDQGSATLDPLGLAVAGPAPTQLRFEPRGLVTATGGSTVFVKGPTYGPFAVTVTAAGSIRAWRKAGSTWQ